MARELVLVNKTVYDNLLKQREKRDTVKNDGFNQSGTGIGTANEMLKTQSELPIEKEKSENQNLEQNKIHEKHQSERPTFYVEKPLSKILNKRVIQDRSKKTSKWINYMI